MKAIVIEDDADGRFIMRTILAQMQFDVATVATGEDGLDWLSQNGGPDLVVLDLNLPGITGADVLRSIRADGGLSTTKVIVATAYPSLVKEVRELADGVMIKPIVFPVFRDAVRKLFPRSYQAQLTARRA